MDRTKKISLFSLIILIIASIDNIRNLPAAALCGTHLIFFFIFAALMFLIPTALVAAELSAAFPEKGGVYQWVNLAFGKKWAMAAIWLQWINTMVWYPSMLLFVVGTFSYLIDPELANNKLYLAVSTLSIFWILTLVNLRGLHVSALINNICAMVGTIFPMLFLIILGGIWVFSGYPLQIQIAPDNMIPPITSLTSWVSLIAIMASFLGMELSGVHVNDIQNPQRNFPRAVLLATLFIFLSMGLGSLAIAYVLPEKEINLVSGVMQVLDNFFNVFGLKPLTPLFAFLIAFGSIGTMINWLISPAKGLLHASEFGFLPKIFTYKNQAGVASNILIAQAVLVSIFCLLLFFQPSVNGFYWFLTALSTELYMIMYILMFGAGIALHYRYSDRPQSFKIPGNHVGMWTTVLLGIIGSTTTIVVSLFPPGDVDIGTPGRYFTMILIGNLVTITPVVFFFLYRRYKKTVIE